MHVDVDVDVVHVDLDVDVVDVVDVAVDGAISSRKYKLLLMISSLKYK